MSMTVCYIITMATWDVVMIKIYLVPVMICFVTDKFQFLSIATLKEDYKIGYIGNDDFRPVSFLLEAMG